jgi:hypothetical protein
MNFVIYSLNKISNEFYKKFEREWSHLIGKTVTLDDLPLGKIIEVERGCNGLANDKIWLLKIEKFRLVVFTITPYVVDVAWIETNLDYGQNGIIKTFTIGDPVRCINYDPGFETIQEPPRDVLKEFATRENLQLRPSGRIGVKDINGPRGVIYEDYIYFKEVVNFNILFQRHKVKNVDYKKEKDELKNEIKKLKGCEVKKLITTYEPIFNQSQKFRFSSHPPQLKLHSEHFTATIEVEYQKGAIQKICGCCNNFIKY